MGESCSARVYGDVWGGRKCSRASVVKENGQWWCRQHAPSAVKARREASQEKWRAERAEREAASAERARRDRLAAHWLEHGPKCAAALRRCVDAYEHGDAKMCDAVGISIHTLIAAEQVPND